MRSRWVGMWLFVAIVVFLLGGTVAPTVLKGIGLDWPPWTVAAFAGAITAIVGLAKPAIENCMRLWGNRLARPIEREQRQAELLEEVAGTASDYPRVHEMTDRALLGIHPAIPLPTDINQTLPPDFPTYVPRDIDPYLRTWLTAHQRTGGFALMIGPAAAGKTRCLYEALRTVLPDWRLLVPSNGRQINEVVSTGANLSQTVVWLDDIPRLLGSEGLTAITVRRLLSDHSRPVLLLGTIWPHQFDTLTRLGGSLSRGTTIHDAEQGLDRDAYDILKLATRFDLTLAFSAGEKEHARSLANYDPRLAEATRNVDDDPNIAQTLAAAPELIRRWRNPSDPYGAAVITAAVVARRCGHPEPLPEKVIRALTEEVLTADQRARAGDEWFADAAAWARVPVRGEAAPLTPQATSVGVIEGDRVSDVLVQYALTQAAAPAHVIREEMWRLLIEHSAPDVCMRIGNTAFLEMDQPDIAELAVRKAALAGDSGAMMRLGWLLEAHGDRDGAKTWFRRAAELGDTHAAAHLGVLLGRFGELDEAEPWLRRAAEAGDIHGIGNLGVLLWDRDQLDEAELWFQRAADAGDTRGMVSLAQLLELREDVDAAEAWYRRAAEGGNSHAMSHLGALLMEHGSEDEAESWFQRAADGGDTWAMINLGVLLHERGQLDEAESWFRRGAEDPTIAELRGKRAAGDEMTLGPDDSENGH